MNDDGIDMVVRKEVIDGGLIPDIFKQDVESLEKLDTHIVVPCLLVHELQEKGVHVSLQEEVKNRAIILVSPNQDLSNGSDSLYQEALVALRDCLVL